MAMTSTATAAAAAAISRRHFPAPRSIPKGSPFSDSVAFAAKPRRLGIRNSSDPPAETAATEPGSEVPAEVPKGPPSLISALNVEKALRGIAITDADHYGRLGVPRGCSYDQVTAAYQSRVEELMKEELEEEEANNKLELLKESYSILSSPEERRLYDWSLARSGKPDRYVWPFEVDIRQPSPDFPPPQEPEDVGPTRLVGYFILGCLVLSYVLSIALNI